MSVSVAGRTSAPRRTAAPALSAPRVAGLGPELVASFLASLGQPGQAPAVAPSPAAGLTDLLTRYTESEQPEARAAALRALQTAQPGVSASQADAVATFARLAPTPEERALDLRTMSLFLSQRPTLPASLIDETSRYVHAADSAPRRIERLRDVAGAFTDFPEVDRDVLGDAVLDAREGLDETDRRARFTVAVPELTARQLLAHRPAPAAPYPPAASGTEMEIVAAVSHDPAVIAAWRATTLAEARVNLLTAEAALPSPDLLKSHPDLQSKFWIDAYARRAWLPVAAGLATAVGGGAASFLAGSIQAVGLGVMASILGGFAVGVAVNALVARHASHDVENRMRGAVQDTLNGWNSRHAELQHLQEEARESALQRAWAEAGQARREPPGEVTVGRDEVVIGGVVVGRRP